MAVEADYIIDFRGTISSISLLKIMRIFEQMAPSEIIEIHGSDPATRSDLFKVLPEATYELLAMDVTREQGGHYRIQIQKKDCRIPSQSHQGTTTPHTKGRH